MADLKILHCPTTVGGNPQGLSKAERALGYNSKSLTITQNYLNYTVDEVIATDGQASIKSEIKVFLKAIQSLFKFNVFHYNFGQSLSPVKRYPRTQKITRWKVFLYTDLYANILQLWDVRAARLFRKVVAVTYQGDDARQGQYCREHYPIHFCHEVGGDYYEDRDDFLKQDRIRVFEKNADLIYSVNPDLLNVLPENAQFIPYASVDPREWKPQYPADTIESPHIIHAPSNRDVKGTRYILDAFNRLESEGVRFRYTLIENMPHEEARALYATADIAIDQILAGYYGAFSVECMALGKPVICYMRDADMHHLPTDMWREMPIINASPDTIYETIRTWITTRKGELNSLGQQSRTYAEKWHDPVKIARKVLDDYEDVYTRKRRSKQERLKSCAE